MSFLDKIFSRIGEKFTDITSSSYRTPVVIDLIGEFIAFDVPVVMSEELIKTTILRLVPWILTQMPFTKTILSGIRRLQNLGDRNFFSTECIATESRVAAAGPEVMSTVIRPARVGLKRIPVQHSNAEVESFIRDSVHRWGFQMRITRDAGVPITPIIRHDQE